MLVLSAAVAIAPSTAALISTHHVHITSELTGGKVLLVHCQSKDDDLGIHNLAVGGEFKWEFRLSIIGHTLFFCYLAPDDSHHVSFDAFKEEDADYKEYHRHTYYIAKDDGVYLKRVKEKVDERFAGWEDGRDLLMNRTRDV
ncbi:S-protein homolog 1 [Linum grandiflorum]